MAVENRHHWELESGMASTVGVTRTLRCDDPLTETTLRKASTRARIVTNMGIILTTTTSRRIAVGTVALCITGGAVVATTTAGANASTAGTATAAVATTEAATPTVRANEDVRAKNLRKYGFHPLPVGQRKIAKYKLKKKAIKKIKKAKKFAKTSKARSVRACESGGNYKINTGNGYYGAYQFDRGTWLANGGGRYAKTANKAPKFAQDLIAYKTWKSRGWSPWACA